MNDEGKRHGDAETRGHGDVDAHGHPYEDSSSDDEDEHHHALPSDFKPHESPWSMTVPLIALAVLSTVGGLVGIPYAMSSLVGAGDVNVFEHTLEPVISKAGRDAVEVPAASSPALKIDTAHSLESPAKAASPGEASHDAHSPEVVAKERWLALLSVALAVFGMAVGWFAFSGNPLRKMPEILEQKWRLDELYNGYIVDPITRLSRNVLWKGFDLGFIDGIVNGIGHFVLELGGVVRRLQVGFVRSYAAIILIGAMLVIGYFIYYGLKLVG